MTSLTKAIKFWGNLTKKKKIYNIRNGDSTENWKVTIFRTCFQITWGVLICFTNKLLTSLGASELLSKWMCPPLFLRWHQIFALCMLYQRGRYLQLAQPVGQIKIKPIENLLTLKLMEIHSSLPKVRVAHVFFPITLCWNISN